MALKLLLVIIMVSIVSCQSSEEKLVPKKQVVGTEAFYYYDIHHFTEFILSSLKEKEKSSYTFLRDSTFVLKWEMNTVDQEFWTDTKNERPNYVYNSSIYLGDESGMFIEEDFYTNVFQPQKFSLQIVGLGKDYRWFESPLIELTVEGKLFKKLLKDFINDKEGNLQFYPVDFDNNRITKEDEDFNPIIGEFEEFDTEKFLEEDYIPGGKHIGTYNHPIYGNLQLSYVLNHGSAVPSTADGTISFPVDLPESK